MQKIFLVIFLLVIPEIFSLQGPYYGSVGLSQNDPSHLSVDLMNPSYRNGTLLTEEGGVIEKEGLRIQAQKISYQKKEGFEVVKASGGLVVQYHGRAYIGDSLEYDMRKQRGVITNATAYNPPFYISGEKILLQEDGSYIVEKSALTTSERKNSSYAIKASKVSIKKKDLLDARNVRFHFLGVPFWLPSFKLNLKKPPKPILDYNLTWDKGAGPRVSLRYQIYSWKNLALFARAEYRLRKGFGGAFETEYFPEHGRSSLVTRSYLAKDVLPTDPLNKRRYRLQGEGHTISPSGSTKAELSWDKFTDPLMPGDFKSSDFEINSAKKNEFYLHHHQKSLISFLRVVPKVNSFQSVYEELPTIYLQMHPILFEKSSLLWSANARASYQTINYSDQLSQRLTDFNAVRTSVDTSLSRAFTLPGFRFTPSIGLIGIYYNKSPRDQSEVVAVARYGASLESSLYRNYQNIRHIVIPYIDFMGLSKPASSVDSHYIFSLQDGISQINLLRFGMKNMLFSTKDKLFQFNTNLYARAFIGEKKFPAIPKVYLDLEWNFPSLLLTFKNSYNLEHNQIDYSNFRMLWTINSLAAFAFEVRYRSKYDYRKADHENFILDVTRRQSEILISPLSDQRMTILSHIYFKPTPFWGIDIHTHHGFLRKSETPYNEIKVDFYTPLTRSARLRLSYEHTTRDDRVSASFDLIKK